jgi:hypothetical protein
MYVEAMTGKTAEKTGRAMDKILDRIQEEYGNKTNIRYILSDDGPEFKGDYIQVLKKWGIEKRRTLAGQPQSNGLVERANGKLKQVISKNKEIFKGTWKSNLNRATKIYNDYENRSIGFSPKVASRFEGEDIKKLIKNVTATLVDEKRERPTPYKVGDRVRLKIAKGKLDKMSTPNWSERIYTIDRVIRGEAAKSPRYIIKGRPDDLRYTRNDVQIIEGKVVGIPRVIASMSTRKTNKTTPTKMKLRDRKPIYTKNTKSNKPTRIPKMVGKSIQVKFEDGRWYDGLVRGFNPKTLEHSVYYAIDDWLGKHNFMNRDRPKYIIGENWRIPKKK